jgi:hypothetical protein
MEYKMHTFLIYNLSEQNLIDENECVPSPLKIRNTKTDNRSFICYTNPPSFLDTLTTKEGPYEYGEMMSILEQAEWKINS